MLDVMSPNRAADSRAPSLPIAVFGLGYVGAVSAACLAKNGHIVIGVDPQLEKVELINNGVPPIIEEGLAELTRETTADWMFRATPDAAEAVAGSSLSLVCVGTPSRPDGSINLDNILQVCEEIGTALRVKDEFHVVMIRSTVLPGVMRDLIHPLLERVSGKKVGIDFGLCHNPEFLREGTAVYDYYNPPKIVIGAFDQRSRDIAAELYRDFDAPLIHTSVEIAELIKYVDNWWHALKVAFGNEVGNICKVHRVDSHQVMDIFCKDDKLNISPRYLMPGFAFGGSCLPKDLRALTYHTRKNGLFLPILESILPSNRVQIERALLRVQEKRCRRIGVLGFSFKAGTNDLRESPMVQLIEILIGKGYDLRLYDRNVRPTQLLGANRDYLHITRFMSDSPDAVLAHAELILVGTRDLAYRDLLSRLAPRQMILDMVRLVEPTDSDERYDGINW
jgi:GDP-mannose 6-dehydrogenase